MWIKMDPSIIHHPKVMRMAEALGLDEYAVVGRLLAVFGFADEHADDKDFVPSTAAAIDRLVNQSGFAAQLEAVGWLRVTDRGIFFVDYLKKNESTKRSRETKKELQRAQWRERKARQRAKNHVAVEQQDSHNSLPAKSEDVTRDMSVTYAGHERDMSVTGGAFILRNLELEIEEERKEKIQKENPASPTLFDESEPKPKQKPQPKPDPFSTSKHKSPKFLEALREFEVMRKKIRKPLTEHAKKLLVNKLNQWSESNAIQALENSITGCWQGVFDPNESFNGSKRPVADNPTRVRGTNKTDYAAYIAAKTIRGSSDDIAEPDHPSSHSSRDQPDPFAPTNGYTDDVPW